MPEARADYRSGQICAVLANIHRVEGAAPLRPGDFVAPEPELTEEEREELDVEATSRAIRMLLEGKG